MRKNAILHRLQQPNKNGTVVPWRSTGPPCNCRAKCFEQVDPELQYHILTAFNHLPNKDKQDQYLRGNIIASDPSLGWHPRTWGKYSENNKGRKNITFQYYMYVPTGKIRSIPKAGILRMHKWNKSVCSYDLCIQYCAKRMQTNFGAFPDFSVLFDEIWRNFEGNDISDEVSWIFETTFVLTKTKIRAVLRKTTRIFERNIAE